MMSNVVNLMELKYANFYSGGSNAPKIDLSMDDVQREKVEWTAKSYQKALMQLVSNYNN